MTEAKGTDRLRIVNNQAEGNAYAKMPKWGGYLRILQPAPTMNNCYNKSCWRMQWIIQTTMNL